MVDGLAAQEEAPLVQVVQDGLIGVLDEQAGEGSARRCHLAAQVDRLDEEQSLRLAGLEVLAAEGRGHVDDAGAFGERYEVGADDGIGLLHRLISPQRHQAALLIEAAGLHVPLTRVVQRLVVQAGQLPPLDLSHHLVAIPQ